MQNAAPSDIRTPPVQYIENNFFNGDSEYQMESLISRDLFEISTTSFM